MNNRTLQIQGKVLKYGDNINTDIISPPQYMELGVSEGARYSMTPMDPDFAEKVKESKILVAGKNFGSGSSRETAPLMLKHLGVELVVADFFARIFYRNAMNVGLLVVESPDVEKIQTNDSLVVNVKEGKILNRTTGETLCCEKIPDHLLQMVEEGGLVNAIKRMKG